MLDLKVDRDESINSKLFFAKIIRAIIKRLNSNSYHKLHFINSGSFVGFLAAARLFFNYCSAYTISFI
jgi:hypothetical protein